ncbi:MFS transporter [Parenemella sanctibonifatiensis]|uniref:MFS transporter n=1 Tax=Parenemella sanctibonifatiensis TaxID=2016505 RepID=UPI0015C5BBCD|nr:MFS transporter [Parenemella sanctibonifatiensis]
MVWFALFVILAEASDSMVSANYGALLPALFPDESRRSSANSLRQGWQLVAMVLALAIAPVLTTQVFGSEDSTIGFRTTAMIYCTIALAALLIMAFGIHERVAEPGTARQPRLWPTIKQILTNRTFWLIGVASACYLAPLAMVLAGVQLYVLHALVRPVGDALYLQGAVILAAALGLVSWNRVVRRIGAPLVWRISFGILAVGFLPLIFVTLLWAAVMAGLVIAAGGPSAGARRHPRLGSGPAGPGRTALVGRRLSRAHPALRR